MSEEIKAIESYEAEIKELKHTISHLETELNDEIYANKLKDREIARLEGMVEAFGICVKARKI